MTTAAEVLLSAGHRDRLNQIINQAAAATGRAWNSLGDITDPAVVDQWLNLWGTVDAAGARAAIAATDGYFGVATNLGAIGVDGVDPWDLRGVSAEDYLMRPIITARAGLGQGMDWTDAILTGLERALVMAMTDVQLGQRHSADWWAKSGRIAGYRRTLTGKSCGLCATASTQRYHQGDLMPIHGRCDCGVAPITGGSDPGQVINHGLLNDLQSASNRSDYWADHSLTVTGGKVETDAGDRFKPTVRQHGELGPVLVTPGDTFSRP